MKIPASHEHCEQSDVPDVFTKIVLSFDGFLQDTWPSLSYLTAEVSGQSCDSRCPLFCSTPNALVTYF